MKLPFTRNKNKNNVPAEIQDYYQAEKRERTGVAWLVAVVTLLVTVAIALGLFFGGRWLYRQLTDDNTPSQETSQGETPPPGINEPEDKPDTPEAPSGGDAEDEDADSTNQPENLPGQNGTNETDDETSSPAAPTPNPAAVPTTGEPLPDTGPGQLISLFAGSSLAGAVLHRALRVRRSRR
jgi:hypothetical protein